MIYLLDTNILIGVITGRKPYANLLSGLVEDRHLLATCSIVVAEVYAGMRPAEEVRTTGLLETLEYLPCNYAVARRAGAIRSEAMRKGREICLADATLAAVAMVHGCVLMTENTKDFAVEELRIQVP